MTKHNSTQLDWTGCECECESEYWSGAGDESVDGGDDSLSSFQSSLAPFLRLSVSFPATRRFLIEMFCTIFLRITTCCLRHREAAISAFPFPFPPTPNALLALNECNVQRATTTTWLNSSLAARVNCTREKTARTMRCTDHHRRHSHQPATCKLPTAQPTDLNTPNLHHRHYQRQVERMIKTLERLNAIIFLLLFFSLCHTGIFLFVYMEKISIFLHSSILHVALKYLGYSSQPQSVQGHVGSINMQRFIFLGSCL